MPKFKIKHKPTWQEQQITAVDQEAALSIVCSEQDWMSPPMLEQAGYWRREDCEVTEIPEKTV
jgi:hypothetical protein